MLSLQRGPSGSTAKGEYTSGRHFSHGKGHIVHLQVTREDYFEAALTILATEGHHALKMTPLCKVLGVTTGSFYNYFGSWAEFAPELLTYWEHEQTARILELSSIPSDPVEKMATMRKLATELPHAAESAIRAWSNGDPAIAQFQRRVDIERFEAIRTVIKEVVRDEERSDVFAIMGLSILVGFQSVRALVDPAELMRVLEEYDRAVRRPPPRPTRGRAHAGGTPQRRSKRA
jgi:AcrR family transcriptional regulator